MTGRRGRAALLGLVVPALLLAAWAALAHLGIARPNLLLLPLAVVDALRRLWATGELLGHIEITLLRVIGGFLCGTAAATLLGALTGYSAWWRRLLDPLLQSLRSIPSMAWIPLFVLWLGIAEAPKVMLIAVGAFFPVYLHTMAGIQQVDRKLVEVARMHGLGGAALVRRVLLPATLPAYVTGLRGGLGIAWMFVVAAEYLGASEGLGFLLIDGQQTGRPAYIIAAILLFAVFGKLSDVVLVALTRRFVSWQDSFQTAEEKKADAADPARFQTV
jgi:sulfonate transport system permease protein